MPYLQIDLDAKRRAETIAKALGLDPQKLVGGLADAWELAWRTKSEFIDELSFLACFGPDVRLRAALTGEGGFFESIDGKHRVRGAKRLLFAHEARRKGGLAAKANLVPGARQKRKASPAPAQSPAHTPSGLALGSSPEAAQTPSALSLGSPTTNQQPTTSNQHPTPPPPTPPVEEEEELDLSADGFRKAMNLIRVSKGFLPEEASDMPANFESWHAKAFALAGIGLGAAYRHYLDDETITARGRPMKVFVTDKIWRSRVKLPAGSRRRAL